MNYPGNATIHVRTKQPQDLYCNLTTNKPLSDERLNQSLQLTIPTAWLIVRASLLVCFGVFAFYIFLNIGITACYYRQKHTSCFELLTLHHLHLTKLILIFFSLISRFIWLLDPYFVSEDKNYQYIFGATYDRHEVISSIFLRLTQIFLYLVLLLQIKSWRVTVRNTVRFRSNRTKYANGRKTCTSALKCDNAIIFSAMAILLLCSILTYVLVPILGRQGSGNIFLFVGAFYLVVLIPSAIYYINGLSKIIVAIKNFEASIDHTNDPKAQRKSSKSSDAIKKIALIRKCVGAIAIVGIIIMTAAVYRQFIDRCRKNLYVRENIKYMVYVVLIHLFGEFQVAVALFYTLQKRRRKGSLKQQCQESGQTTNTFISIFQPKIIQKEIQEEPLRIDNQNLNSWYVQRQNAPLNKTPKI